MKANIARIDNGKNSDVNAKVSKLMSKTSPHHCHIVGYIRPKLLLIIVILSTSKVRPHSRKLSSSKTTHVCHHCGASGHTHPNCFKLFSHKRESNRSHPLSKGSIPILG